MATMPARIGSGRAGQAARTPANSGASGPISAAKAPSKTPRRSARFSQVVAAELVTDLAGRFSKPFPSATRAPLRTARRTDPCALPGNPARGRLWTPATSYRPATAEHSTMATKFDKSACWRGRAFQFSPPKGIRGDGGSSAVQFPCGIPYMRGRRLPLRNGLCRKSAFSIGRYQTPGGAPPLGRLGAETPGPRNRHTRSA